MRISLKFNKDSLFGFVRSGLFTALAGCLVALGTAQADTYDEVASEDSVIASGLPTENLELRQHSEGTGTVNVKNMLLNTWNGGEPGNDYASIAASEASQEYIIFKFDFASVPANATITGVGDFGFDYWYTHCTDAGSSSCAGATPPFPHNNVSQETLGEFEFYEITAATDHGWIDRQFEDGSPEPGAVTYNSLGGTFTKLTGVTEVDNGVGGPLVAGKLISNGVWHNRQQLTNIPAATLERLRNGTSAGLAMGSIANTGLTNFSIHSSETFFGEANGPRLSFEFTTGVVFDPADFDEDGDVDADDLATWQASYASDAGGDTDADTDTDGADFLAWQGAYTGPAVVTAVPEPTTLSLLGLAALAAVGAGRRRVA